MMITPLGTGGGCHGSVMVVKVLLKAWSPVTGPGACKEEDQEDGHTRRTSAWCHMCHTTICILYKAVILDILVTTKRGEL